MLRGAPYVPSHGKTIDVALDLVDLKKGDKVVDWGAGDGAFLKAAAKRGLHAVGYEINPVLCLIAWLRCWSVRGRVTVRLRDFWLSDIPADTNAVYFFLAGPFMHRAKRKLLAVMEKREKSLLVVSNGFAIPGLLPHKVTRGVYLYKLQPGEQ